jgi:hypothetical protein
MFILKMKKKITSESTSLRNKQFRKERVKKKTQL